MPQNNVLSNEQRKVGHSVTLDTTIWERLTALAAKQERSRSFLIEQAVMNLLNTYTSASNYQGGLQADLVTTK